MAKPAQPTDDYFLCESCGAELPTSATFCRHCGASGESGWEDHAQDEPLDLPAGYGESNDFDYDEFLADEFPDQASPQADASRGFRWAVVVLLCLGLLGSTLLYFWH